MNKSGGNSMRNLLIRVGSMMLVLLLLVGCNSKKNYEEQPSASLYAEGNSTEQSTVADEVISEKENSSVETPAQSSSQQQLHDTLIKYISGDLNVRELPQHDSKLVGKIDDFYTKLYFYGETKEGVGSDGEKHTWYKIRSDSNINGWVRSDLVISQDANVMYPYASDNEGADYWKYTDHVLEVRSEPTCNSKLVGKVTDCNTYIHSCYTGLGLVKGVDSDGQLYEWTKVVVNSELQGWVRYDLLMYVSSAVWVDDIFIKNSTVPLNVRAQPQHDSELITSIENADTKMYYWGVSEWGLGSDGIMHEWYQVDVSSTERGWVRSDLIKSVLY